MKVTFACPVCGKTYRNIKPKMVGRKARCSCGNIIRIGQPESQAETQSKAGPASSEKQLKPPQPKATSVPLVNVNHKTTIIDNHYSDLDDILGGQGYDQAVHYPVQPLSARVEVPKGLVQPVIKKPSSAKSTIGFLAAIASATIAFWFGLMIVLTRLVKLDHVLLQVFAETFTGIHSAKMATETVAAGLKIGFVIVGWAMCILACSMMLLAVGQFLNASVQLFTRRQILRWVDGLMATSAILFVFVVVATLFLHSTHVSNLNRDLNKIARPGAGGESTLQNVQRIRDQYDQRSRTFVIVLLVSGSVPMAVFVFSIIRLFVSPVESKRDNAAKSPVSSG